MSDLELEFSRGLKSQLPAYYAGSMQLTQENDPYREPRPRRLAGQSQQRPQHCTGALSRLYSISCNW